MSVRSRALSSYPWHVIIPVTVYLLLSIGGITQSSIGIDMLREDPSDPTGVMLGEPSAIRSDEFLTSTPIAIGVTATGSTEDFNPLTGPQAFFAQLPSGPVSSVVIFDGTALRLGSVLPDEMLIAARWWLPFLLLVLATPPFFRFLTGSRWIGYFAAALIVFSPSSAWWSFGPVQILGFAIAGSAALQLAAQAAHERRWWVGSVWALSSALMLARVPLYYQPWVIMLASAVVLTAVAGIVGRREGRGSALAAVAGAGTLSVALMALIFVESWPGITAAMETVYPGRRVATGGANPLQEIFGGTSLSSLEEMATFTGTNQSEISSSFAVAFVWVLLLLARGVTFRDGGHRAAVYASLAVSAFWVAWSTIDFGSLGERIPLANLVPSSRAADVVGYLAVILLCLVLPGVRARNGVGFALLATGVTGAVAASAGSLLRLNIGELSIRHVWISSFLVAVVVFVITLWPRRWHGYTLAGLLALVLVWDSNPVLVGLGDLRGSGVAQEMLQAGLDVRTAGEVWVADHHPVDTLLIATGVPSLSGRQLSGPETDAWEAIDPGREHDEVWNRGGSYIWFEWTEKGKLTLTNPGNDIIHISGSPCTLAQRVPELATVIASHELDQPCLTETDTFVWGGAPRWVYAVSR